MAMNRPDEPLRGAKGADARDRSNEHPDRLADVQERSEGAHAEFLEEPTPSTPDDGHQGRGVDGSDGPPAAAPHAPADAGARSEAPSAGDAASKPSAALVGIALIVFAVILIAMIGGVFTT